jgi:hypothetical protein
MANDTVPDESASIPLETPCIVCGTPYGFGLLCDGRCAFCWQGIAEFQIRRGEGLSAEIEARGVGYMQNWGEFNGETVDRSNIPGLTDACPYDNQTQPQLVAMWHIGYQHRKAEVERVAAQAEANRFREALTRISNNPWVSDDVRQTVRAALASPPAAAKGGQE